MTSVSIWTTLRRTTVRPAGHNRKETKMHRVTKAMLQEKIKHVNQIRWGHDGTEWPMPKGTFNMDWAYNKPAVFVATRSDSHGGGRMVIPRGTKTEVARGLDILVHGLTIGNCGLSALED